MLLAEQLEKWRQGNPVHNDELGCCCPDFSCCKPELLASKQERDAFVKAYKTGDVRTQDNMLIMFLSAGLAILSPNTNIHIVGEGLEN